MVITGDDLIGIQDIKLHLSNCFDMNDLGPLRYFLDIKMDSSPGGYILSQDKYASDLISRVGLTDNKVVDTPLELNIKLRPADGEPFSDATL